MWLQYQPLDKDWMNRSISFSNMELNAPTIGDASAVTDYLSENKINIEDCPIFR